MVAGSSAGSTAFVGLFPHFYKLALCTQNVEKEIHNSEGDLNYILHYGMYLLSFSLIPSMFALKSTILYLLMHLI